MFEFDVIPIGKPRMTRSDAWRQRKCVMAYWAYKDKIQEVVKETGYKLTDTLMIEFIIPMPKSWSKKKCALHDGTYHTQKPDIDNLAKAFMDSVSSSDETVHTLLANKSWGVVGKIRVYQGIFDGHRRLFRD